MDRRSDGYAHIDDCTQRGDQNSGKQQVFHPHMSVSGNQDQRFRFLRIKPRNMRQAARQGGDDAGDCNAQRSPDDRR
ncbi:hypothetical protein D3C71_1720710 [compost metagenome]